MNILILKFPYNSALGGGELHTLQLFAELKKRGYKFYLASSCNILSAEFKKREWPTQAVWTGREPVSIKGLILFTLLIPYTFWRLCFLLLKYRISRQTDRLYCLTLTEKLLATIPAKLLGYKVFWMEHLRIERWLTKNPYRWSYVWLSNLVTVITVSQAVKKQLIDLGLKDEDVKVIYNGIDINEFKPEPLSTTRPSYSTGLSDSSPVTIATVCRLAPEKGVDYLIGAFKKVAEQNPDVELQIAGQGPEKVGLEKLTRELGLQKQVKFLGFIKSVPDFLNKIDIFTLTPTRRESFGISAAEASACGKPVVATDISGLREVVKNNETGLIVASKNVDEIAAALLKLIENPGLRAEMGQQGRARVQKYFTVGKMVDDFAKVLAAE